MRLSELANLEWNHFNLNDRQKFQKVWTLILNKYCSSSIGFMTCIVKLPAFPNLFYVFALFYDKISSTPPHLAFLQYQKNILIMHEQKTGGRQKKKYSQIAKKQVWICLTITLIIRHYKKNLFKIPPIL